MDQGDIFVIQTLINFAEISFILILLLYYGAKINDMDKDLKQAFVRISKEKDRLGVYSAKNMIFKWKGRDRDDIPEVAILDVISSKKFVEYTDDIWFKSEINGEVFQTLDNFEKLDIDPRLEFHTSQIDQTLDYVD